VHWQVANQIVEKMVDEIGFEGHVHLMANEVGNQHEMKYEILNH